jgi:hypothetical protein
MKKILLLISLSIIIITSFGKTYAEPPASSSLLGITVSFSTKAYWDGATKSCLPRTRGWCLHFEIDVASPLHDGTIRGELSNLTTTGLTLSFNKKTDVTAETFLTFFKSGKFLMDGDGTISEEIAKKLGLAASYVISQGAYSYKEFGDRVTINFSK